MNTLFDADGYVTATTVKRPEKITKTAERNRFAVVDGVYQMLPDSGVMVTPDEQIEWTLLAPDETATCGVCGETSGAGHTMVRTHVEGVAPDDDNHPWAHVNCFFDGRWIGQSTKLGDSRKEITPSRHVTRTEKDGVPGVVARHQQCKVTLVTDDMPEEMVETVATALEQRGMPYSTYVGADKRVQRAVDSGIVGHYWGLKITGQWLRDRHTGANRIPSLLDALGEG